MRRFKIMYEQDFEICPLCDVAFRNGDNIISLTKNAYPKNFVGGDPVALFHAECFLRYEGDQVVSEIISEEPCIIEEEKLNREDE